MNNSSTTLEVSPEQRIAQLQAEIEALKNNQSNQIDMAIEEAYEPDVEIPLSSQVKVINLFPGRLNLSREEFGRGGTFKFESFGQIKKVTYADLLKVMETHQNFMDLGYFMILDKRVVHNHGLGELYSKLLIKDQIDDILSGSFVGVELFSSATKEQQDIIIKLLVEKIVNDPNTDLNLIDKYARISGVDIVAAANFSKEIFSKDNKKEE